MGCDGNQNDGSRWVKEVKAVLFGESDCNAYLFVEEVVILPLRVNGLFPPQLLPREENSAAHCGVCEI